MTVRQKDAVRTQLVSRLFEGLTATHSHLTFLPLLERDVFSFTEQRGTRYDLAVELAEYLMAKFEGAGEQEAIARATNPSNRTRRRVKKPKGPRGVKAARTKAERRALAQDDHAQGEV